jgi:hypothetical protein
MVNRKRSKMPKEKTSSAVKFSLIGSILILLNGIWVAANAGPIVLTTDPGLTTVEAIDNALGFWGRISFGIKGMVEGLWTPFWLLFTIALFGCIVRIYLKPRRHNGLGLPMVVCSILSFPIGGGFLVGSILVFIGGMLALEWPKSFGETFIGKMIRTAMLDSKAIGKLSKNPETMRSGVIALVFTSIIMGFGNAIYVFNTNLIKTQPTSAYNILLRGSLYLDTMTIANAVSFVGITFLRWLVLSSILYVITVKVKGRIVDFGKLATATAFAFVPLCLQGFLPVLFSNEPFLSFDWPIVILVISIFWVGVGLVVLVREMFEIQAREALGVTIFAGVSFWFVDNLLVGSNPLISMPGVVVKFDPASSGSILLLVSFAVLLAILLGALSREPTAEQRT